MTWQDIKPSPPIALSEDRVLFKPPGRGAPWVVAYLLLILAVQPLVAGNASLGPWPGGSIRPTAVAAPAFLSSGYFVENLGQFRDSGIRFVQLFGDLPVAFGDSSLFVHVVSTENPTGIRSSVAPTGEEQAAVVRVSFDGAHSVSPRGRQAVAFPAHFFLGSDAVRWRTHVPVYSELVYEALYDGIDLVFRSEGGGLKYDFRVQPGANSSRIAMRFEGVDDLALKPRALVLRTAAGTLEDAHPVAWQGQTKVPCSFSLIDTRSVGFTCDGADPELPLDIDPFLYATYLGGGALNGAISVGGDPSGFAYVAGGTQSSDFPTTPGAYDVFQDGLWDAFVVKVHPSGRSLEYATFVGGSGDEVGISIAVDRAGGTAVTGQVSSMDFPVTPGGMMFRGEMDAFLFRLSPAGDRLVYSSCFGGTSFDDGRGVALDAVGNAYVTGYAFSPEFPVTLGAFDTSYSAGTGSPDAFVVKVSPVGTIAYSTFLGGTFRDVGWSIAADPVGNAYVAGLTGPDFPVTNGSYRTIPTGGTEGFLAKLDPTGTSVLFATYLGGSGYDEVFALDVDGGGAATVVGYTNSEDFPTTPGAYDTVPDWFDAFVTQFDPTGSALVFSTRLGGAALDEASSVALQADGGVFVAGYTNSTDFPTTPDAFDRTYGGPTLDVFVTRLTPPGDRLAYGTYLGGSRWDTGGRIALVGGALYVTGTTNSPDFPVTPGAFDTSFGGMQDGFLAKFGFVDEVPQAVATAAPTSGFMGDVFSFDGTSSTDDSDLLTHLWDFGDGTTAVGPTVTHAFSARGTFVVNLTVRDTANQSDSDAVTIWIQNRDPVADAGADGTAAKNTLVTLDGSASHDEDMDPLFFGWVQAGGPPVSLGNPFSAVATFTAVALGSYAFSLSVGDGVGGTSSDVIVVTVSGLPPVAALDPNPITAIPGAPMTFDASASRDPDGLIVDYRFDFGDGREENGTNPVASHTYASPGSYVVSLTVLDDDGFEDRAQAIVAVIAHPATGDFFLTLDSPRKSLRIGQASSLRISVSPVDGFDGAVIAMAVTGIPEGVLATLDRPRVVPPETATLALEVGPNSSPGVYLIVVRGISKGLERVATLELTILPGPSSSTVSSIPMTVLVVAGTSLTVLVILLAAHLWKRRRGEE